ncbi:MAG: 2Fe-2S iron-sulfur cluster-binding protein, partial [Dehalococcoidia bacterium]
MSEEVGAKRLNSGIRRGERIEFYFDGQPLKAFKGETIAAALMA